MLYNANSFQNKNKQMSHKNILVMKLIYFCVTFVCFYFENNFQKKFQKMISLEKTVRLEVKALCGLVLVLLSGKNSYA